MVVIYWERLGFVSISEYMCSSVVLRNYFYSSGLVVNG